MCGYLLSLVSVTLTGVFSFENHSHHHIQMPFPLLPTSLTQVTSTQSPLLLYFVAKLPTDGWMEFDKWMDVWIAVVSEHADIIQYT